VARSAAFIFLEKKGKASALRAAFFDGGQGCPRYGRYCAATKRLPSVAKLFMPGLAEPRVYHAQLSPRLTL
jgi:hypothetical protein